MKAFHLAATLEIEDQSFELYVDPMPSSDLLYHFTFSFLSKTYCGCIKAGTTESWHFIADGSIDTDDEVETLAVELFTAIINKELL